MACLVIDHSSECKHLLDRIGGPISSRDLFHAAANQLPRRTNEGFLKEPYRFYFASCFKRASGETTHKFPKLNNVPRRYRVNNNCNGLWSVTLPGAESPNLPTPQDNITQFGIPQPLASGKTPKGRQITDEAIVQRQEQST